MSLGVLGLLVKWLGIVSPPVAPANFSNSLSQRTGPWVAQARWGRICGICLRAGPQNTSCKQTFGHSKQGKAIPAALYLDQWEDIHIISKKDAQVTHEPDIILFSYMLKAAGNGAAILWIVSDDTDVFVLLVYANVDTAEVQMEKRDPDGSML